MKGKQSLRLLIRPRAFRKGPKSPPTGPQQDSTSLPQDLNPNLRPLMQAPRWGWRRKSKEGNSSTSNPGQAPREIRDDRVHYGVRSAYGTTGINES
eukprot:264735-Pelagomonas_calceolata.AAC.5